MIWSFQKSLDPIAKRYLETFKEKYPKDGDVADRTVFALDAETTGFKVGEDRILSLAAYEIRDRQVRVVSGRDWILYQDEAPINEAMKVHGILPSETAEGEPEAKVLGELLELVGNKLIVGHHIRFDAKMLAQGIRKHYRIKLKNKILDTAVLAQQEIESFHRTGYANQPPPTLEEVCGVLGLDMVERHTALGDAFTTALVFLSLCARLRRRLGRPVRFSDLPIVRF